MMPQAKLAYWANYGWHFNKTACEFAVSKMRRRKLGSKSEEEPIKPYTKEEVDELLKKFSIKLERNQMYDYVYIANKIKADYWGSSVEDERHLALHIKDDIDDVDAKDGDIMTMWMSKMRNSGYGIPWAELLE